MAIESLAALFAGAKSLAQTIQILAETKQSAEASMKTRELIDVIFTLQDRAMALQEEKAALIEEKHTLKAELVKRADWATEAQRYQLQTVAAGVVVYALKPDQGAVAEPIHWLCPNCYQAAQKSILQRELQDYAGTVYRCPRCQASIRDHDDCAELSGFG